MKIVSFVALGIAGVMMLAGATGNRKVTPNNKLSPPAETSMKLGVHVITIEYNAPSARGRKVEGGLSLFCVTFRFPVAPASIITPAIPNATKETIFILDLLWHADYHA